MKQVIILSAIALFIGCGNQKVAKMEMEVKEEVGTVVVVMADFKQSYSKDEIIQLSKAIDPMVDTFEGYLGRKMCFPVDSPSSLVDVVYYTDMDAFQSAAKKEMQSETCQRFFQTMDSESEQFLIGNPIFITETQKGTPGIVEMVFFKSEYSEEELSSAAAAINPKLNSMEGFVSRKLVRTEDDLWIDLVYWTALDKAKNAAKTLMADTTCQKFFSMINGESMQFMHLEIVIDTEQN